MQVFEEATTYPCILFAQKSNPNKDLKVINIDTLKFPNGFQVYIDTHRNVINQNSLNNETWIISNSEDQDLLEKIKSISKPLNEFLTGVANYGIKTGLSSAFFINEKTKNQVIEYVYKNYKSYKNKELIVEEFNNCFHIKINKDESPLILGKGIIK